MRFFIAITISALTILLQILQSSAFHNHVPRVVSPRFSSKSFLNFKKVGPQLSFGQKLLTTRQKPLRDLLGLGPAEIAIVLVAGLFLFGPETLKSLSKDIGKAAAELKEIPKTFKEGMDEGAEAAQISRMKQLAAEKRKRRDEKNKKVEENEDEDDDEDDDVKSEK